MKCALCQINEADKENTHYLTDSIIRSCLNYDGSNEREKGFYYDISSSKLFIDFNFQREASVFVIEGELGKSATNEEIKKAQEIPFSVDYVFCKKCEDLFSKIENKFATNYLPQLRNSDLSNVNHLVFDNSITFRLFFLMQVWRTSICTDIFNISSQTSEKIRKLILAPDEIQLKDFPLVITYLTTTGGQMEYTKNFVGYASGTNPNIIFMNDFVIQFYEQSESIRCEPLYGINDSTTFRNFLNYRETKFVAKIISNNKRKEILNTAVIDFKVKPLLNMFRNGFINHWTSKFKTPPSALMVNCYINGLIDWKDLPQVQRLSQERVQQYTNDFFKQYDK